MKRQFIKIRKKKFLKTTKDLKTLEKGLNRSKLYDELIQVGAFDGDHFRFSHISQDCFLRGLRNKFTIYNTIESISLLSRATRFLKECIVKKEKLRFFVSFKKPVKFVFVGNPMGSEEKSKYVFHRLKIRFFPNDIWIPGFLSKRPNSALKTVLIVYDLSRNYIAFQEAVNARVPVVAFASPKCDLHGVDYPILLNLDAKNDWYTNFCYTLFKYRNYK